MLDIVARPSFRRAPALRLATLGLAAFCVAFPAPVVGAGDDAFFKERVAPILAQKCLSCHHGDTAKGGLDLSTRKGLLAGGDKGPVLVAGNAGASRLLQMVSGKKPAMPKGADQPLSAGEVAALRAWIDAGANWPEKLVLKAERPKPSLDWWSIKPVVRPEAPKLKDAAGVRNPIDQFIRARLEAEGLAPSKEADRLTLIRRLTFDLHGLPPTPEEVDAFVKDEGPAAYEKVVDRLLASPRYGERWGRHWLDVVHYGDTHGYDRDKRRPNGWPYRDYVIRSLNADKPYSRFVREQLAGDVLFPKEKDGLIATGFIAAGPWDFEAHMELREGTVDRKKTLLADRDDMLTNAMSTFSSLTVHCARCHDHKFDPIPQKDYFRLQAVFAGVERRDRIVFDPAANRRAALEKDRQVRIAALPAGWHSAHGPATYMQATGFVLPGFPAMGSWISYGLGSMNNNLPTFVVLPDSRGYAPNGPANWGPGFLPAAHQGTMVRPGARPPIFDLAAPANSFVTDASRKDALDVLNQLNRSHAADRAGDSRLEARINSYELAARLQLSAPEVLDISMETRSTRQLYGVDDAPTREFGRNCLITRRLLERGVRFVQLWSGADNGIPRRNWDSHENIQRDHGDMGASIDRPIAGLIHDLKARGLFDDTIILWTTEFGRMPCTEAGQGRDHNPFAFTNWLAGGGFRGGLTYGASDEWSYRVAENPTSCYDIHATILHQLGIDHERLTFRHNGIDRRLTDVHGRVIREIVHQKMD